MTLFGTEVATFFSGLQADNSREWFTTDREQYEQAINALLERLLDEAEPVYGPGHVMRPDRDVRFSAKKSPFETNASLWAGTIGGVYLQLDAQGMQVGGGLYEPTRDQLGRPVKRSRPNRKPHVTSRNDRRPRGERGEVAGAG